jgi:hypothetical protein
MNNTKHIYTMDNPEPASDYLTTQHSTSEDSYGNEDQTGCELASTSNLM